jgi:hypothetical protein
MSAGKTNANVFKEVKSATQDFARDVLTLREYITRRTTAGTQ